MIICMRESAKQESAKHGACEIRLSSRAHIPDGNRPHTQLPPFLGLSCWSAIGRSRSRLRFMRYKASAKQLLELILIATTLSIGTPRCSLLCHNPPKEPPPLSFSQREGIKRGTPTTPGSGWMGRAGAQQHQAERRKSKAQSDLARE